MTKPKTKTWKNLTGRRKMMGMTKTRKMTAMSRSRSRSRNTALADNRLVFYLAGGTVS